MVKKNQDTGRQNVSEGRSITTRALSQSNYLNVIIFLEEAELITAIKDEKIEKKEKKEKKEVSYALTEKRAEMEVLRRRLFKLL